MTNITTIQSEIKKELANKDVLNALVTTTFKGLKTPQVYLAIQEGMMRGFEFKDFLEKNVYAIPFRDSYSLVTSVDYARKVGMRSGVVGKSAPTFEEKDGKIISCTVTIKRKVGDTIGDYTATVYFGEYSTGKNLWTSKPRTMISKVAEMHALRMACPEQLSQSYAEEELEAEKIEAPKLDITSYKVKLQLVKTMDELKTVWSALPIQAKNELEGLKNDLKTLLSAPKTETPNENA